MPEAYVLNRCPVGLGTGAELLGQDLRGLRECRRVKAFVGGTIRS